MDLQRQVIHCPYYLLLQLFSIMLLKPEIDQKTHKTGMMDCSSVQNQTIYNQLQLGFFFFFLTMLC